MAHCRVLPPGESNGMILELLPVYSENFMTTAWIVSRSVIIIVIIIFGQQARSLYGTKTQWRWMVS